MNWDNYLLVHVDTRGDNRRQVTSPATVSPHKPSEVFLGRRVPVSV